MKAAPLHKREPLLAIIMFGRNDDYQDHWIKRLEYCLNFNIWALRKIDLGEAVEFHISDHFSSEKIVDNLRINYGNSKVFVHEIGPVQSNNSSIHASFAQNTGVHRSRSQFLMFMGVDQIFTPAHWQNLINFLEHGIGQETASSFYAQIPRIQFFKNFEWWGIDFNELNTIIQRSPITKIPFRFFKKNVGGGAGALVISRLSFIQSGMFDLSNSNSYGGGDIELRSKAAANLVNIDTLSIGVFCYKLPYSGGIRSNLVKKFVNRNKIKTADGKYFYNLNGDTKELLAQESTYELSDLNSAIQQKNMIKNFINLLKSTIYFGYLFSLGKLSLKKIFDQFGDFIQLYEVISQKSTTNFLVDRKTYAGLVANLINEKNYFHILLIGNVSLHEDIFLQTLTRTIDQSGIFADVDFKNIGDGGEDSILEICKKSCYRSSPYLLFYKSKNGTVLKHIKTPEDTKTTEIDVESNQYYERSAFKANLISLIPKVILKKIFLSIFILSIIFYAARSKLKLSIKLLYSKMLPDQ